MSRNLRVYKQSELASRDTTSPHFLHEINSAGSRPWDGGEVGGGGRRVIQTLIKVGAVSKKSVFGPWGLSFRKNTGPGWAPRTPPLDPPLTNTYWLWHHRLMNSPHFLHEINSAGSRPWDGGEAGHPDPYKSGVGLQKLFFRPLGPQFA